MPSSEKRISETERQAIAAEHERWVQERTGLPLTVSVHPISGLREEVRVFFNGMEIAAFPPVRHIEDLQLPSKLHAENSVLHLRFALLQLLQNPLDLLHHASVNRTSVGRSFANAHFGNDVAGEDPLSLTKLLEEFSGQRDDYRRFLLEELDDLSVLVLAKQAFGDAEVVD